MKIGLIGLKVRTNLSLIRTNLGVPLLFLKRRMGQITLIQQISETRKALDNLRLSLNLGVS